MKDLKKLSKKIYKDIMEYSEANSIPLKKLVRDKGIPYTTFTTWVYKLKEGRIIPIRDIIILEEIMGKDYIFLSI